MYGDGELELQESDQGPNSPNPEEDHPADQLGLEVRQACMEVSSHLRGTLLELGLEPSPVEFIDLTQLGSIRRIHGANHSAVNHVAAARGEIITLATAGDGPDGRQPGRSL